MLIAVVVVWAIILGFSPGLAVVLGAVALLALDRYDPRILDRVVGRG